MRDLTGEKIGALTIIGKGGRDNHNHMLWLCKCECGREYLRTSSNLGRYKDRDKCTCQKQRVRQTSLFKEVISPKQEQVPSIRIKGVRKAKDVSLETLGYKMLTRGSKRELERTLVVYKSGILLFKGCGDVGAFANVYYDGKKIALIGEKNGSLTINRGVFQTKFCQFAGKKLIIKGHYNPNIKGIEFIA